MGRGAPGRFLAVGVANTAVSFAVFHALLDALGLRRGAPAMAQLAATVAGMTCSYLLNRSWTFRSEGRPGAELTRFVASQMALLASSTVLIELTVGAAGAPATPAWLVVTAALTVVNYVIQRRWVFRRS